MLFKTKRRQEIALLARPASNSATTLSFIPVLESASFGVCKSLSIFFEGASLLVLSPSAVSSAKRDLLVKGSLMKRGALGPVNVRLTFPPTGPMGPSVLVLAKAPQYAGLLLSPGLANKNIVFCWLCHN